VFDSIFQGLINIFYNYDIMIMALSKSVSASNASATL